MSRFYLRLIVAPLLLLTAVLLLIYTRHHDDHALRNLHDLLQFDGCPAPCFMGIRPGLTTESEAISRLKANTWVMDAGKVNPLPYMVTWSWKEDAPPYFERLPSGASFMLGNEIFSTKEIVSGINFSTTFTLGDVLRAQDVPSAAQLGYSNANGASGSSTSLLVALDYQQAGFWATGIVTCPYSLNFWNAPVRFNISDNFIDTLFDTIMASDRKTFIADIYRISRKTCS